jgi:hypothetical protein
MHQPETFNAFCLHFLFFMEMKKRTQPSSRHGAAEAAASIFSKSINVKTNPNSFPAAGPPTECRRYCRFATGTPPANQTADMSQSGKTRDAPPNLALQKECERKNEPKF